MFRQRVVTFCTGNRPLEALLFVQDKGVYICMFATPASDLLGSHGHRYVSCCNYELMFCTMFKTGPLAPTRGCLYDMATEPMPLLNSCSPVPVLQQLVHCCRSVRAYGSCFFARWALVTEKLPGLRNSVTSRCNLLFGASLPGYALLNALRRAGDGLIAILLVNAPCSHLHCFGATDVSSGLATGVTLTRLSRGRLGESVTRGSTCFWFSFCALSVIVIGLLFKWYILYLLETSPLHEVYTKFCKNL
jgi:hypothetical protein